MLVFHSCVLPLVASNYYFLAPDRSSRNRSWGWVGVMVSGLDLDVLKHGPHDDEEVSFVNCCV